MLEKIGAVLWDVDLLILGALLLQSYLSGRKRSTGGS